MKSMIEIKTGHENACAEFVKVRDYALAERTSGSVAEAHTQDAEGWLELAGDARRRVPSSITPTMLDQFDEFKRQRFG